MPEPLELSALGIDLSPRVVVSTTVVASPAAAAETIIASLTVPDAPTLVAGILLVCQAAFTVGTTGVSARLRVRQTDVAGAVKADSGAVTEVAANLDELTVVGFDAAPAAGRIYKGTLTVASGTAPSTVSVVTLLAIAV